MIVIYTQDETFIRKDAAFAGSVLITVYGEKLGEEAYVAVKNGRIGASYRKNGGPLVRVITEKTGSRNTRKRDCRWDDVRSKYIILTNRRGYFSSGGIGW